jgi:hypothetical protein
LRDRWRSQATLAVWRFRGPVRRTGVLTSADLADYLHRFKPGGYPVDHVAEAICTDCARRSFRVEVDDEEGCARRICAGCGTARFVADSAGYWDDAEPGECECPCGGHVFAVLIGFALLGDGEVHWVSVSLRYADGRLGVSADWTIGYSPSRHLLSLA